MAVRRWGGSVPVPFPCQALHAQAIVFVHPLSGQPLRVEMPCRLT